jgi:hypothetical protein
MILAVFRASAPRTLDCPHPHEPVTCIYTSKFQIGKLSKTVRRAAAYGRHASILDLKSRLI